MTPLQYKSSEGTGVTPPPHKSTKSSGVTPPPHKSTKSSGVTPPLFNSSKGSGAPPIFETLLETRLIAIIRMKQYEYPVDVAGALVEGGVRLLEFTMSGEGALQAITQVRSSGEHQARIGAGTVLTPTAVKEAASAGAEFIVTPSLNLKVIAACQELGLPILCGALTPTEITTALDAGVEVIKLFPARLGGPQYVRDLLGPFPRVNLVPTGGVSAENAASYLEAGAVAVAIGGNLVAEENVSRRNFSEITRRARACVQAVARQSPVQQDSY